MTGYSTTLLNAKYSVTQCMFNLFLVLYLPGKDIQYLDYLDTDAIASPFVLSPKSTQANRSGDLFVCELYLGL